jgi:WD40 repeat protein
LINTILQTRGKTNEEVGLIGANVVAILLHSDREAFVGCDLSGANLAFAEFEGVNLTACNLREANLSGSRFTATVMEQTDLRHAEEIYDLCLSPDETFLAVGGHNAGLLLLSAHDLSEIWHLKDIGMIYNPIFTSTGEWIFVQSGGKGIVAVLAKSGIKVTLLPAHSGWEVAISPDDTFLVSASDVEGTIQFWDIRPFVTITDEPHISLADFVPADLSPFFQDSTTWPEWYQKCDLPIPPGTVPNPNFGNCLRTIQYHSMNCKGLRLAGAKGLDTVKIHGSEGKRVTQKATTWLTKRGAIMKEQSGTRKSKRTKGVTGEQG